MTDQTPGRLGGGIALACGVVTTLLAVVPAGAQTPLTPAEVLTSVERSLPLLERARQDVRLAEGQVTEAQGGFDLSLSSSAKTSRGLYDNDRFSALLQQPLSPLGVTTYGGYRTGDGTFGTYDSRALTYSGGEAVVGLSIPLLRNREVDARRADRQLATLGVSVAEQGLAKARLSYFKDALGEYWNWVAAGRQLAIAKGLLDLALARDQQLADSVALGQTAPVERTDNRRAILQRQSALITAERQLQLQSIDLSLYLRAGDGTPVRPDATRLPVLPRPDGSVPIPDERHLVEVALARRPDLKSLRLKRDQLEVDLRLAANNRLPSLDFSVEANRDFGAAIKGAGPGAEAGLTFTFPLQNRKASGKRTQVQAKLSGVSAELRWAEDRVRADVQDAISALRAAAATLDVITQEVAVARELEGLERDRFALGDSTQFLVNLRELATADAALREVKALADYQKALVTVEAATGQLADRVSVP